MVNISSIGLGLGGVCCRGMRSWDNLKKIEFPSARASIVSIPASPVFLLALICLTSLRSRSTFSNLRYSRQGRFAIEGTSDINFNYFCRAKKRFPSFEVPPRDASLEEIDSSCSPFFHPFKPLSQCLYLLGEKFDSVRREKVEK